MVVLIEDLSAREQQLMKPTVIAHRLLRTHTHTTLAQRTPAARPPPTRNRGGAALCQGARLTLSPLSATGRLALLQVLAGRVSTNGARRAICSC